jgi:excisionase family DNA binding protein
MKSPEPWVSLEAIASHLDVSPDTVYRWIEKKEMPCTKIGSRWKFKVSESMPGPAPARPPILRIPKT